MFFRDSERRSNGMWRYSVRRITDGAFISMRCECSMWPLCSSMRATPLKIITTARRSVHTLIGSNEAFRTRTRAFMVEAILREPGGECQKMVSKGVRGHPWLRSAGMPGPLFGRCEHGCSRTADKDVGAPLTKLVGGCNQ